MPYSQYSTFQTVKHLCPYHTEGTIHSDTSYIHILADKMNNKIGKKLKWRGPIDVLVMLIYILNMKLQSYGPILGKEPG